MKRHLKLYKILQDELRKMPRDVGTKKLLETVQCWLRSNLSWIDKELRSVYQLDELANLDISQYPTSNSSIIAPEEVRVMMSLPPTSMDTLMMRVQNLIMDGVTVGNGAQCPRCNSSELRVFLEVNTDRFVLECDRCTWLQDFEGNQLRGALRSKVAIPTIEQLKNINIPKNG